MLFEGLCRVLLSYCIFLNCVNLPPQKPRDDALTRYQLLRPFLINIHEISRQTIGELHPDWLLVSADSNRLCNTAPAIH
jgi:hypothetical protein